MWTDEQQSEVEGSSGWYWDNNERHEMVSGNAKNAKGVQQKQAIILGNTFRADSLL